VGVARKSDTIQGVLLYQGGVDIPIHNSIGPATEWVCCKSPDAKWGPSTSVQVRSGLAIDIA